MNAQNELIDTVELDADDVIVTSAHTMKSDMMGVVIDTCKGLPDVWQKLSEEKQQDFIESIDKRITNMIETCIKMIASDNRPYVYAKLDQVTFKGAIEAKLKIACPGGNTPDGVLDLAESTGQQVMIIIPEIEDYEGSDDDMPKPQSDQPDLVSEDDPLYEHAKIFIEENNHRISITALQRGLQIGYNRAANLLDQLEFEGFVTPVNERGIRQLIEQAL